MQAWDVSSSTLFQARKFCSTSLPSKIERIGFIGLGNMGSRMANNLIKAGCSVAVHDINDDVMKAFSKRGVLVKNSPLEVAEESDAVITMVPSSTHVMGVYTGPKGILNHGDQLQSWLFIDSFTFDPQTSRKVSAAVSTSCFEGNKGGCTTPAMLDAPVSGGFISAEMELLLSWLVVLKKRIRLQDLYFSPWEKTCLRQLGIGASTLTEIFNSSSARCWSSDTYNPVPGVMEGVPASRDYNGGFSTKLMMINRS